LIGKWFDKLKSYVFGDDEEPAIDSSRQENQSNSSGRVNDSRRSIEPKVINRYPEGRFRFPVIPDQSVADQEKEDDINSYSYINKSRPEYNPMPGLIKKNRLTKPKFTGRNFKAQDIPSPVFGYGERSLYIQRELANSYMENKAISEQEELTSHVNQSSETEFIPEDDRSPVLTEEFEDPDLSELKHGTDKHTEHILSVVQNEPNEKEASSDEWKAPDVEKIESSPQPNPQLNTHQEITKEEQTNVSNQHTNEDSETNGDTLASTHENETKNQTQNNIQTSTGAANSRHKSGISKKGEQRRQVPFNVLMLKQDRRNIQAIQQKQVSNSFQFPPLRLLEPPIHIDNSGEEWLSEMKELLQSTLENFSVKAKVIGAVQGPAVTRLEVQPAPGVKVSKITNLSDDIKLSLAARDLRIEAPIPGRNAVGIEVPNLKSRPVMLSEIIKSKEFTTSTSPLTVVLGLDISGQPVVTDLQKMPHGLIAGATGSGKSVCINSILISLFYKANPEEVKLLLVDPKMVELAPYNNIPHLVTPVITDSKEATSALKWTVQEMERRYEEFSNTGVREIKRFNQIAKSKGLEKMPYIVVIIDELADLMMVAPQDVEEAICRIAQKARACGIHLLLATQRPSVDVITGLIKANIPTRVAFSVSSQVDSRTIIDASGAEKLLGKGDMLFLGNGFSKPERIQGTFVSDEEIDRITEFTRKQRKPNYLFERETLVQSNTFDDYEDDIFAEACEFVLEQGTASSSALQRRFRIGFNRAARLIEMMESKGFVSEAMGSKPRNVLISKEEFEEQIVDE
jgi:S-DNA-T family DNA segregation ATPase FtsK/SpoIIIE